MIKPSQSINIDSHDYLIDTLNQFLKIIRSKLQLTFQLLLYFKPNQTRNFTQTNNQKMNNRYSELKLEENEISGLFKKIKIMNQSQKRTLDRFCLRVYQHCQTFCIKMKKNKCFSADYTDFLAKIQNLFSKVKSQQGQIILNQLVNNIIEEEQRFKFNCLNKAYSQLKYSQMDIAQQIKQLYMKQKQIKSKINIQNIQIKNEKQLRIQQKGLKYQMKQQQKKQKQIYNYKQQQLNRKFQNKYSKDLSYNNISSFVINDQNMINRHHMVWNNQKKILIQKQRKPKCKHCKSLLILDILNLQQVYHDENKCSQKIMQQLIILNQQNFKMINGWQKLINKKKQMPKFKYSQNFKSKIIKRGDNQVNININSGNNSLNLLESESQQRNLKKRMKGTRSVILKIDNPLKQIKEDENHRNNFSQRIYNPQYQNNTIENLSSNISNSEFQKKPIEKMPNQKGCLDQVIRTQNFQKLWSNVNNSIKYLKRKQFNNISNEFDQIKSITQILVLPKINNKKRF